MEQSHTEGEQGIIIFYSCSANEGSYEIEELQQGSFTYALLEALTNRVEGNAATVERLDKYLRHRVAEINQQYGKKRPQIPYATAEPVSKSNLILSLDQAKIQDVQQLKQDAFRAEVNGEFKLAEELWMQILDVSPTDLEAVKALERIVQKTRGDQDISLQFFEFETVILDRRGEIIKRETKQARYFTEDLSNNITLEMVAIPGGTFTMGAPETEEGSRHSERPQHQVTVPAFFMSKYPVTQAQWRAVAALPRIRRDLEPDPSSFKGDNRPVESVSWFDATEFCARLSTYTKREYRLPSEAEWEYACRAGTTTPFHFGEMITTELANYNGKDYTYGNAPKGKYREQTTPVGTFLPNGFGLYDMHGNVLEWCADIWHFKYKRAPTDGSAWVSATENDNEYHRRVLRGGSWDFNPAYCRSAYRYDYNPVLVYDSVGFRVVCGVARTISP